MIKKIFRHFSKPTNLLILNAVLIAILLVLNTYFQAFCIPTTWAIILLTICFANTILHPVLVKTRYVTFSSFIHGVTLFVFIYCAIFLEQMHIYGLVLMLIGIGLVILIPYFFIAHIIWRNVFKPATKVSRYYFISAIILCSGTVIYIKQEYHEAIKSINKFMDTNYQDLDKNFMTEKILGMHFIYHTRYCEFDGWRPPKHEPILVIGMWLNKRYDPLKVDLSERLELYKHFFPNNKYKFDCSCAIKYKRSYHEDNLWK